ncbi:MAG: hypothetical protein CMJ81_21085, partial [Planctomycetaceae bacterium]|nr:hypothetical protein [Planctomycetaceae bacterium]
PGGPVTRRPCHPEALSPGGPVTRRPCHPESVAQQRGTSSFFCSDNIEFHPRRICFLSGEIDYNHYMTRLISSFLIIAAFFGSMSSAAESQSVEADFFERRVRPLLVSRCMDCHGDRTQENGLRLDSLDSLLAGGDSGPAIVPGDVAGSLLAQAVRREGALQMPPEEALDARETAVLERWIGEGASWPETEGSKAGLTSGPAGRSHWAFQPVRDPELPAIQNVHWPRTSVDPFVLEKLEAAKLAPSVVADRRTLLRRVTFDLLGLPPTYEEMREFQNDPSDNAYEKVVDRLLASPSYGERWGRLWLDVARYADNKGFAYFEDLNYPYAYTYRDYVIAAFNHDLPYDEFVIQQIAADHPAVRGGPASLAALGFLTVGQRFMNNLHDVLDDRIDVVTRGLMGLTVACARCHDHKYDPVPTADYYSLYGVFRSSAEPIVGPLLNRPADTDEYRDYQRELDKRVNALTDFATEKHAELVKGAKVRADEYLLAAQRDEDDGIEMDNSLIIVQPGELNPTMTLRWQALLRRTKHLHDPVLTPWHAFASLVDADFAGQSRQLCQQYVARVGTGPATRINPYLASALAKRPPANLEQVSTIYGELLRETEREWQSTQWQAAVDAQPAPRGFRDRSREELRQLLYAPGAPANLPLPDIGFNLIRLLPDRKGQEIVQKLLKEVEQWIAKGKETVPRAMVLVDSKTRHEPRVFHRGNAGQPRESVPRKFLSVLSGVTDKPFQQGSGRYELARAIVSPQNPLTGRVIVNRIWMHHFGAPLVSTPSDFGVRSEMPLHRKLLDHLVARLVAEGWSVKKLHRRILLSTTFRQTSIHRSDGYRVDPENQMLWRQNLRRLQFEGIRDSLLSVAGTLDGKVGGVPDRMLQRPFPSRRTVYGFVNRSELPILFSTFDFPSPDATSGNRPETIVPQQTLYMMNNHFVVQCAGDLWKRAATKAEQTGRDVIRQLYRILFARDPRPEELRAARGFLQVAKAPGESYSDWTYGHGEIDLSTGRLVGFEPLSNWSGTDWRDSKTTESGAIYLDPNGGVTSAEGPFVVRRWTSPLNGHVTVRGTLSHVAEKEKVHQGDQEIEKKKGDGVRASLISSRFGGLGEWLVHGDETATGTETLEVRKGDTLDFVVDGRKDGSDDGFQWPLRLYKVGGDGQQAAAAHWNSRIDFRGVQAESTQQLAQALLMTSEFIYVD